MIWLYLLAITILAAVVVLLVGRAEGAPGPVEEGAAGDGVSELLEQRTGEPLAAGDLREVRFSPAVRGYRMDEVDLLLRRLADQLDVSVGEAGQGEDATGAPGSEAEPADQDVHESRE